MVFFATPVMRTVALTLLPSTNAEITAALFAAFSTFAILTIMLARAGKVKEFDMLFIDGRLGGVQQWVIGDPEEVDMGVPRELLECICYVYKEYNGQKEVIGTAFVVGVSGHMQHLYLVTARHCVESSRNGYYDLIVRFNTIDGGATNLRLLKSAKWHFPEVKGVDLAVLSFDSSPNSNLHFQPVPIDNFLDESMAWDEIGPGDELLITGLFHKHSGIQKNYPIVRSGIIAAMPSEPLVDDKTKAEYHAFLAEVRSIGGLSGSPVFVVYRPQAAKVGKDSRGDSVIRREVPVLMPKRYYLLGLIRGHWDMEKDTSDSASGESGAINMGIAAVTPSAEIRRVLMSEALTSERDERTKEFLASNGPTPD